MKKQIVVLCILIVVLFTHQAVADSESENRAQIDGLKLEIEQLEQTIQELQTLVDGLETAMAPIGIEFERAQRKKILRKRFEERSKADDKIYTREQIQHSWKIHLEGQNAWGTRKGKKLLKQVVKLYPKSNLAGCSILYLGQMSKRSVKEDYLKQAIAEYGDCYYGDGVQVGAYATYRLARYYREQGQGEQATKLFNELKAKYPDAVDHKGKLLLE